VVHVTQPDGVEPCCPSWWSRRGAIPSVPHVPHPADDEITLLYVGISPVGASSRQTVRSRIVGSHYNGNVGSSTFHEHGKGGQRP
jgi:hypothetical protein